jgi:hypothetical protein
VPLATDIGETNGSETLNFCAERISFRASDSDALSDGDRFIDRVAETSVANRSAGEIGVDDREIVSSPTSYEPLSVDSGNGCVAVVLMDTVSAGCRTPIALTIRLIAPASMRGAAGEGEEVAGPRGSSRINVCTNRELSFRRIESSLSVTTTFRSDYFLPGRSPIEPTNDRSI